MATITKRMTKSRPSYRIQVKMRDKGSGKLNVYSTTWRPPAGLTQKQMEREVVIYADKYESELKMSLTAPGARASRQISRWASMHRGGWNGARANYRPATM